LTRRRASRFALALFVSGALTALWALPLVLHPNTRVLGGPSDATSTIRDYWYVAHIGKTPFTATHDSLLGAPEGIALSPAIQAANGFQPAFVWLLKGAVGLVAAWNLFVLAGIALSGACMWLLLDWLGVGAIASVFGAYAYGASGYLVDKAFAGHGGLTHAWVFPLIVLALLRGRRSPQLGRFSVLAGLLVAAAFYIHSYYGAFALFLLVLYHVYEVVGPSARAAAGRLGAALAAAVVALVPALVAMRVLQTAPGNGSHPVAALQQFGARVEAYLAPSEWTPLGHLIPQRLGRHLEYSGEPSLFFGFSTLALALYYLLRLRRRDSRNDGEAFVGGLALTLAVAAAVMSLPRLFSIGPIGIPMPSWFLGHVSTTIRVYARFGVLVGLGLTLLAALAVGHIHRARGAWWAVACVAVLALELTPTLPAKTWQANVLPASDRWLAAHPGGIAAVYPLVGDEPAAARLNGREYYFQRFHEHPLFSAIVPSMPPISLALRQAAKYFTDADTATILAAEHVRYVVLREDVYREMGQATPTLPTSDFRLVARVRDARIYRVIAPSADRAAYIASHGEHLAAAIGQEPPVDRFGSGFYGPEQYKYATPWRWMSQDGKISVRVPDKVTQLRFETLAFSNGAPRTLRMYGPDDRLLGQVTVPTGMTPITVGPFDVHGGTTATFTFTVSPGPVQLGPSDPRPASIYVNEPVFRPLLTPSQAAGR
jgi:hypothetical protein